MPLLLRKSTPHKVLKCSEDDVIGPCCLGRDTLGVRDAERVGDFATVETISQQVMGQLFVCQ